MKDAFAQYIRTKIRSSFENLLDKERTVSIHHRNLWSLAIEMYKAHRGISPATWNGLFPLRPADLYNLRNSSQFIIPNFKTVNHGFESLRYLRPKITETIPSHLKEINSLKNFKNTINDWKQESCPCRFCKIYIQNIGYMQVYIEKILLILPNSV